MVHPERDSVLYSEEEFKVLYEKTAGFNDETHSNHPLRPAGMSFEQFMDDGSDLLIGENSDFFDLLS